MDPGNLLIRVLDPIPTVGLTSDDVNELAESTRQLMLKTLIEISQPVPGADKAKQIEAVGETGSGFIPAMKEQAQLTEKSLGSAKLSAGVSETGSTEDEMDDDAVLLKRPKEEV